MCILTLLLYYLNLKGISFEVKIGNQRLANIVIYSSILISVIATISMIFEFDFFENEIGSIRYDEFILFANVILISIMMPLLPKRKKMNHKEHRRIKKEFDKTFNIMWLMYSVIMICIISYLIYQKVL